MFNFVLDVIFIHRKLARLYVYVSLSERARMRERACVCVWNYID